MNSNRFEMQTISAHATTRLVGRKAQLQQIEDIVTHGEGTWVVQVSGSGGIGKTRLILETLRRHKDKEGILTAREPVDLYHGHTHSIEGLMAAICEVLDEDGSGFPGYREARAALERYLAEPSGQARRLQELREKAQKAFLDDLNALAAGRRVLLALDTAEKLVYEVTEVERRLGLAEERLAVWNWLRDVFLPLARNTMVLLAGRPQLRALTDDLDRLEGVHHLIIPLSGFTEDEALAYFEAIAEEAIVRGDAEVAGRIRSLPEEWRRAMARKSRGRPILLALLVDYMVITPVLPYNLYELDEEGLEKELVRAMQETGRPTDEALRALAWARKGVSAELLARVAEHRNANGTWDVSWAQSMLEEMKTFSFVKVRPADQRLFLHDEMYDLLERHVLQPDVWPAGAKRAYDIILAYYRERIETLRQGLAEAYQALSQADKAESALKHIGQIGDLLQEALVEDLYYQLRADVRRGFEVYYRYAEEAALGENTSLDAELRAELLEFLAVHEPSGRQLEVAGLPRTMIDADAAIRWVKRFIAAERHTIAAGLAEAIRKHRLVLPEDPLSTAELMIWEALARLYAGSSSPEETIQALEQARELLTHLPRSWRRDAVLARAYNNLGYARRVDGQYREAVVAYRKAIPFWRWVKIEAEHANTLNNLAFAQAEIGEFSAARRQARDALELRQKMGARPQIGLSLTTLAQIANREGLFVSAQRYAGQAAKLFEAANDMRGLGLAWTALAEALRRFGAEGPCPDDEADRLLKRAIKHAKKACEILAQMEEPSREIEALIELGCCYRDRMKHRRRYRSSRAEVEHLADQGRKALKKAVELAGRYGILHRQLDALINEAWLEYYLEGYYRWMADLRDPDAGQEAGRRAESLLTQAERLVPKDYLIEKTNDTSDASSADKEIIIVPILSRMGKLCLLCGQRAYNEFEEKRQADDLCRAIEYYTLSLAYDALVGPGPFRDKRRGQDRVYERLKTLNPREWQIVFQTVRKMERDYGLGRSEMRHFLEENFGSEQDLTASGYDYDSALPA